MYRACPEKTARANQLVRNLRRTLNTQPAGTEDYLPAGVMAVPRSQQVSEAIFEQEENLKKVSLMSVRSWRRAGGGNSSTAPKPLAAAWSGQPGGAESAGQDSVLRSVLLGLGGDLTGVVGHTRILSQDTTRALPTRFALVRETLSAIGRGRGGIRYHTHLGK